MTELLYLKSYGLVGPNDSFHIDAWTSAHINLVTHAHGDHARCGSNEFWCSSESAAILRHPLGADIKLRTLITEATFSLPIYHWATGAETTKEIFEWWQWNKSEGNTPLLFCYFLGKAQRILAELMRFTDEEVLLHGAVLPLTQIYRDAGISMLPTQGAMEYTGDLAGHAEDMDQMLSHLQNLSL